MGQRRRRLVVAAFAVAAVCQGTAMWGCGRPSVTCERVGLVAEAPLWIGVLGNVAAFAAFGGTLLTATAVKEWMERH